ncbi:stress responsive A/B barrel domain-containing protein [Cunninghamella echinulata]|nr:stress responsive A/B barrel domain-containing protein [Cunninghamella echinulata]
MTIVHIVIVKFHPEVNDTVKQQVLDDVLALKNSIPQIIKASAGKNFTNRSQGFDWGWVVELESKEDLSTYSSHPEHQVFLSKYKSLFSDLIAVDYEN